MLRIEELLNWPVRGQVAAQQAGTFGSELERRLAERTAAAEDESFT